MSSTALINVCQGSCCSSFWINPGFWDIPDSPETEQILRMVVPIGGSTYTCQAWDRQTKRCLNYRNRPYMCWGFPYDKHCPHAGCEFAEYVADALSCRWLAWLTWFWKYAQPLGVGQQPNQGVAVAGEQLT